MVLGLRALVAAGAESVMVLHTGCQLTFQPERDSEGKLGNAAAFEDYIRDVQQRGKSSTQSHTSMCGMIHAGMYAMFRSEGAFSSATQEALMPLQEYTSIP